MDLDLTPEVSAPDTPVHFVYLNDDTDELDASTEFNGLCHSVPRVGDIVSRHESGRDAVVERVYHKFVTSPDGEHYQVTTVALRPCVIG